MKISGFFQIVKGKVTMNNIGINMNCVDKNTMLDGTYHPKYKASDEIISIYEFCGLAAPWGNDHGWRDEGWRFMRHHRLSNIISVLLYYADLDDDGQKRAKDTIMQNMDELAKFKNLTSQDIVNMAALNENGTPIDEIAERYEVSEWFVSARLKERSR